MPSLRCGLQCTEKSSQGVPDGTPNRLSYERASFWKDQFGSGMDKILKRSPELRLCQGRVRGLECVTARNSPMPGGFGLAHWNRVDHPAQHGAKGNSFVIFVGNVGRIPVESNHAIR